ncbi:hypothetical protein FD754_004129 [Muntiacus muntjak]|uniref:Uncharacterized protein n=1 Tax=Muntiacus muntjak TaxID=9888 RepID=A0A5N3WEP9_MUNMU|nr:hypothetical protein FD754_004129 [Muntiacus muntjak]
MMPLAEAGSGDQGGGPAGTEQTRLGSAEAEAQASYMAIPAMLKARAPRRCGEPSAVPKDRKGGCCYRGQHRQRLGGGLTTPDAPSPREGGHTHPPPPPHTHPDMEMQSTCAQGACHMAGCGGDQTLEAGERAAGPRSAPWRRDEALVTPLAAPPPDPAHCVLGSGEAPPAAPGQVAPRPGKVPAPPRAGVPSPQPLPSPAAEPASLQLLQHTRSARRNYSISGAQLMRSNYLPPLSSAALSGIGPTRHN